MSKFTRGLWKNDFVRGTVCKLLQVVLLILGLGFGACGVVNWVQGNNVGWVYIIIAIVCFCARYGVKYYLGSIVRFR